MAVMSEAELRTIWSGPTVDAILETRKLGESLLLAVQELFTGSYHPQPQSKCDVPASSGRKAHQSS